MSIKKGSPFVLPVTWVLTSISYTYRFHEKRIRRRVATNSTNTITEAVAFHTLNITGMATVTWIFPFNVVNGVTSQIDTDLPTAPRMTIAAVIETETIAIQNDVDGVPPQRKDPQSSGRRRSNI